ncbi:MAG: EamA family transporter [Candidatus Nanoarchaeia archaeon]|nr:EamA family transporter [Candidatus Nanoarchaeia archaeon]MDD5740970.1 EamA family transporter [Candidatus Nanoarchaeia archaeon]
MWQIPLIGSILEGAGNIIDKKIVITHKINYKNCTVYSFLALVLVMLPLTFFFWEIKPEAYSIKNLLIFMSVILFAILANLLAFFSLKRENITELEPIRLMQPLFIVLLAFIFSFFFAAYYTERKYSIIILALIASIALIASHLRKHHLVLNKYIIAALLGSFFFAVELVISKEILPYYSSVTFYFLRCLLIFIIAAFIFHPSISSIKTKTKLLMLLSGIVWTIYRLILYYGYLTLGVVFTTILFILSPIFIFIFARIFLKEKILLRQIIASVIIIACVIAAILLEI